MARDEMPLALFASLAHQPRETCAFAYFDAAGALLGMRHTPVSARDAVEVPIRHVAADTIALQAASVVMAHNHPSGDPTPSDADIAVTHRLARGLDALGVRLTEHLILAGERRTSLRAAGVL